MFMQNESTTADFIDYKIEVLHDFCLLKHNAYEQEAAIRSILSRCRNEYEMDAVLHNVLRGNESITELINRKGVE